MLMTRYASGGLIVALLAGWLAMSIAAEQQPSESGTNSLRYKIEELEKKVTLLEASIKNNRQEVYRDIGMIVKKEDVSRTSLGNDLWKHTERATRVKQYQAGFPTGESGENDNTITVMLMPPTLVAKCQSIANEK